jgi:hypothetical protein
MTSNNQGIAAIILAAAAALIPVEAAATVVQAASFDEKVQAAESIVLGRCVKTHSQFDPTGRWILTYATFQVEESMKGQPTPEITIVTPGGEANGIHQDTIGVPSFRQGDEHVLFVRNSRVGPTVLFFDQGAYNVATDERGQKVVKPIASEVVRMDTQRGVAVAPESQLPLRSFENNVRESIRRTALNQMGMVTKPRQEPASFWRVIANNKLLVALALIGALIATWRVVKR